jgi:uncharacterized protein YggE
MRLLALLLLPLPALALDRTISVSGECHHMVTPDRGALTVTAEFRDMDLRAASRKATEAYEKVRDQVKRLSLENVELRTSEYTLSEINEWESTSGGHGRNVFKGYRARMGLYVGRARA